MKEEKYVIFKVKNGNGGEFREVKLYPDIIPKDGEEALIILSDNETETMKPLIRRISVNDESILIMPGIDETTPHEVITDNQRYSVTICGVVADREEMLYEKSHINKAAYLPNMELKEAAEEMMKYLQNQKGADDAKI